MNKDNEFKARAQRGTNLEEGERKHVKRAFQECYKSETDLKKWLYRALPIAVFIWIVGYRLIPTASDTLIGIISAVLVGVLCLVAAAFVGSILWIMLITYLTEMNALEKGYFDCIKGVVTQKHKKPKEIWVDGIPCAATSEKIWKKAQVGDECLIVEYMGELYGVPVGRE